MRHNLLLHKSTKKVLQAFSIMAILFSPAAVLADPPRDNNVWSLTFSDEFNGTTLNTKKWNTCYWWGTTGCNNGGSGDLNWYQPDDVIVKNGKLNLRAQQRKIKGYDYTSGMIASHDKYAFQYGYAEIRAKLPKGRGLWPTFWLGSQRKVWPPEIDIMEHLGHQSTQVHLSLHHSTPTKNHVASSKGVVVKDEEGKPIDLSESYNTYGLQWEPQHLIWYINGKEYRRYTTSENVPAEPMYLMATLALGAAWTNTPPDSTTPFPSTFEIDYIKVWRHNSSPSTPTVTPIISEVEGLTVEKKSSAAHYIFDDEKLSQGVGITLKAKAEKDFVTYTVNVPEARTFNVRIGVKTSKDRGKFQMAVNTIDQGQVQDLYSVSSTSVELDMGNIKFDSAGHKSFKFTVTGKNPSSQGHKLALDYIKLIPK